MNEARTRAAQSVRQRFPQLQLADVEDSVCEALVQLMERVASGQTETNPFAYLRTTAVRVAQRLTHPGQDPLGVAAIAQLSVPDFADRLIAAIDLKREIAGPRTLLSVEAETWQLKALVGLSAQEVSKRLCCCKETVYRRVRAANEKLLLVSEATDSRDRPSEGGTP